jgi:putative DNA primase/helicase
MTKQDEKVTITHTKLAHRMEEDESFFSLDDTHEFYLYHMGCYTNEGTELKMQKLIREKYHAIVQELVDKIARENGIDEENKPHIQMDAKISLVNETLAKLRSEKSMTREDLDKLQSKSGLINFKNGIYSIKTRELIVPIPELKLIRQIPVNYDPSAKCPKIEEFLDEVVSPADKQLLLEIIGYSMIPDTHIQKACMLYGPPGTGKSIFLQLLEAFIGKKNCSHVSLQQLEEDKYRVADLYGKLLNIYPDLKDGVMQHDNVFKTIVGGDTLTGERKFQHAFTFNNTARMIFSANEENLPRVKSNDEAFYRRWILIRFPHKFYGSKDEDISLIDKLTTPAELSGLANLAIEALRKVMKQKGYTYSKTADEIESEYTTYSSSAHRFISSCIIPSDNDMSKLQLYEAYEAWCDSNGLKPVANNKFGGIIKKQGYGDYKSTLVVNGVRPYMWRGIEISGEVFVIHEKYKDNKAKEEADW